MEENSLFRHDEQCVNIEGEEERDAMVKADRGAIFVSREDHRFELLLLHRGFINLRRRAASSLCDECVTGWRFNWYTSGQMQS